jgi:hypothetical protein
MHHSNDLVDYGLEVENVLTAACGALRYGNIG